MEIVHEADAQQVFVQVVFSQTPEGEGTDALTLRYLTLLLALVFLVAQESSSEFRAQRFSLRGTRVQNHGSAR